MAAEAAVTPDLAAVFAATSRMVFPPVLILSGMIAVPPHKDKCE
jgi:hypothetical protein